jgi:hypothetical protein
MNVTHLPMAIPEPCKFPGCAGDDVPITMRIARSNSPLPCAGSLGTRASGPRPYQENASRADLEPALPNAVRA